MPKLEFNMCKVCHKILKGLKMQKHIYHKWTWYKAVSYFTHFVTVNNIVTGYTNEQLSVCSKQKKSDITGTKC